MFNVGDTVIQVITTGKRRLAFYDTVLMKADGYVICNHNRNILYDSQTGQEKFHPILDPGQINAKQALRARSEIISFGHHF